MKHSAFVHGNILTPSGIIQDGTIYIKDKRIDAMGEFGTVQIPEEAQGVNAYGYLVAPGYIDTHIHGGIGFEFMNGNPDEIAEMLRWLASTGVTSVLPTIATAPLEEQLRAIEVIQEAKDRKLIGAEIIGIHLEGPYINSEKCGAQAKEAIRTPDLEEMKQLLVVGKGLIELVTLAPELPGGLDLIQLLVDQDVAVSIGHSAATYEQVIQAADAGLRRASHLFNGMTLFHHRHPGAVGAVLTRDDVFAEVILDGMHLHPAAVQIVLRSKGLTRMVLITNAISAAGLDDGNYIGTGGQKITIQGGSARLESGVLAGSTLTLDQAVRNAVQLLGLTFEQAIRIASQTAAEGLSYHIQATKGVISPGKDADLIVLDNNLKVLLTMVGGEVVYQDPGKTIIEE